ncbi:hypothetical protein [Corallococcus exiguus]|uniref:Uncharacterized protein n=1 Tax=Corallococcus exiguus TaxID=83462 RepID=A0A7X4YEF1_9BACT|nr:hypothetical protein [Corallococcus exiguus]NBC43705.1 hypothetical protein [Corallococcus exiguus]TNV66350.1 hypothetical protein FH620_06615 [Corallococcus exiguus]
MSDPVRVIFRNQTNAPVTVIINGYQNASSVPARVYSGQVTGMSGVFQVSGYASYACSAYATTMLSPALAPQTDVSIVFTTEQTP